VRTRKSFFQNLHKINSIYEIFSKKYLFKLHLICANFINIRTTSGFKMSRINIEDSLFKDGRFIELAIKMGSRHSALGAVVEAFILAQEFFLNKESNRMIPLNEWKRRKAVDLVIDAGLAEIRGEFVYVCGAEKQFSWLIQRQDAGLLGGRKKSNAIKHTMNKTTESGTLTTESGSNPLTLTHSLSLTHSHIQTQAHSQNTVSEKKLKKQKAAASTDVDNVGQKLVAVYCELWKKRYNTNPPLKPSDTKNLKSFGKENGFERTENLLQSYFKMPDAFFIKKRHDLATFLYNLSSIAAFAESGKVISNNEVNQLDKAVASKNLIDALRNGEI